MWCSYLHSHLECVAHGMDGMVGEIVNQRELAWWKQPITISQPAQHKMVQISCEQQYQGTHAKQIAQRSALRLR